MIAELVLAATIAAAEPAAPAATSGAPACDLEAMRNERAEILQPSIDRAAQAASAIIRQGGGSWQTVDRFAHTQFPGVLPQQPNEERPQTA
ncbi:MAG: hypothetical protein OXC15_18165, partial [Rhodospirillaceae bacterium]|nr:hypothetical protein [Rhodospirillaceae bacterium]